MHANESNPNGHGLSDSSTTLPSLILHGAFRGACIVCYRKTGRCRCDGRSGGGGNRRAHDPRHFG